MPRPVKNPLSAEQEQWLRDNYTMPFAQLLQHLGLTWAQLRYKMKVLGLSRTKAKASGPKVEKHPVGTIHTRTKDTGYQQRHIKTGNNQWMPLSLYHWQQAGYELPTGYVLCFKDGNSLNDSVENLEAISRAEAFRRNRQRHFEKTAEARAYQKQKKVQARKQRKSTYCKKWQEKRKKDTERAKKTKEAKKIYDLMWRRSKGVLSREERRAKQQAEREAAQRLRKAKKAQRESEKGWQQQKVKNQKREKQFKIRVVDYSQMVAVRVDKKTLVYVPKGSDEEAVKAKYLSMKHPKIAV